MLHTDPRKSGLALHPCYVRVAPYAMFVLEEWF